MKNTGPTQCSETRGQEGDRDSPWTRGLEDHDNLYRGCNHSLKVKGNSETLGDVKDLAQLLRGEESKG